ncbi:MAG TPA: hypothetical protein DDW98_04910, partial [Gammaproteobacteria bacterium]|nr:hypothetical protein [Gammaproteobacteria bacterium]
MMDASFFRRWLGIVMFGVLSGCSTVPGIVVQDPNTPQRGWAPDFLDPLLNSPEVDPSTMGNDGASDQIVPRIIPVTPDLLREQAARRQVLDDEVRGLISSQPPAAYRIGAQDILNVLVWDHPELSNPMGNFQDIQAMGRLVREDGTIFFPYAGVLRVEGKTVEEVRRELEALLTPYIQSPQVDVRVV